MKLPLCRIKKADLEVLTTMSWLVRASSMRPKRCRVRLRCVMDLLDLLEVDVVCVGCHVFLKPARRKIMGRGTGYFLGDASNRHRP